MVDIDYLQSHLGPIDFIAIEIPEHADVANGMRHILDLVDQHTIRVIDFEFVTRAADGTLGTISPSEIGQRGGFDFSVFEGASSGLLDGSDFEEVAATLESGSIAAILVYEELALLPALAAFEAGGSTVIGTGSIDDVELAEVVGDD
jgi:hypothetical protein